MKNIIRYDLYNGILKRSVWILLPIVIFAMIMFVINLFSMTLFLIPIFLLILSIYFTSLL